MELFLVLGVIAHHSYLYFCVEIARFNAEIATCRCVATRAVGRPQSHTWWVAIPLWHWCGGTAA
jgi:hypothetical protein